jgi:apolipoprotein N-acyltransferase
VHVRAIAGPASIRTAIALLCGCLIVLSCAPYNIWPLAWIAWTPVIWIALTGTTRRAWAYGLMCGLAANAGGYYWLFPYLQRFAHLPVMAALAIFLLFVAYHAIAWALFCHLMRQFHVDAGIPVTFLAPIVLVALEAVMPTIFAWNLAITQANVLPVIQIAELTGPLGVSFLIMLGNAAAYEALHAWYVRAKFPGRHVVAAGGIVAACVAFGFVRMQQVRTARAAAATLMVGVVQANIGIDERGRAADARSQLATQQRISADLERAGAELILWPESSYPYVFRRDRTHDWPGGDPRRVREAFRAPLIFGAFTMAPGARSGYNSALLLGNDDNVRGRFDKNILILFGEYVPFAEQLTFITRWVPDARSLARGTDVAAFPVETRAGTVRVGPMICYEDIFASFGRRLAARGPNLLINLTNDAWFGDTSEPWQHLAASVFRAVELRLDLVRAVNNGVSAVIDSTGRVHATTRVVDPVDAPTGRPDTLLEQVTVQRAQTLYATLGEWFGGVCVLATALLMLRVRTRGRGASARRATL